MKKVQDENFEDGYYYPPAPVGETILMVGFISVLMLFVLPLSLYLSSYLVN